MFRAWGPGFREQIKLKQNKEASKKTFRSSAKAYCKESLGFPDVMKTLAAA